MRYRVLPAGVAGVGARVRVRLASVAVLCAVLAPALAPAALAPAALARHTRHARRRLEPQRPTVTISVDRSHPGAAVPPDFLGLSFEVSSLPLLASYGERGDLVRLLRSLGPGVLRLGGVSADTRVAWTDGATPRPSWASSVIDPADLRRLAGLAAASGWHVLLTIGLVHYEPQAAAREAAAARAALGEWLQGIELGNEPNAYALHGQRAEPWAFLQYDAEVAAYRNAIEAAAPGIPIAGPDVSGSSAFENWGPAEAVDQQPAMLTGHHYPLGCKQLPAPSIGRLLSPPIRRKEGGSLRRYMAVAQASDIPFRLDETNTVSCGGTAGISNSFASALWAADYVPEAMAAGVSGINLHGNPANCRGYSPLCAPTPEGLAAGQLVAQPEWYALLLAKSLIGASPLPTGLANPKRRNVVSTAFLAADRTLRYVIVDDDPPGHRGVAVRLPVGGGYAGASVMALTGPSPGALSGLLLGGRPVAPDGSWSPAGLPRARNKRGVITVNMKPSSAALVSVAPRPAASR